VRPPSVCRVVRAGRCQCALISLPSARSQPGVRPRLLRSCLSPPPPFGFPAGSSRPSASQSPSTTARILREHRPSFVRSSAPVLGRRLGWQPLLWSRWGRDWEARAKPVEIAARATRNLTGGDVVLLHDADHYSSADSWRRTAAALPSILSASVSTGERFVTA